MDISVHGPGARAPHAQHSRAGEAVQPVHLHEQGDARPMRLILSDAAGSIPPPVRGRSTPFASLRSKWCRVGVGRPALAFGDYRGRELTPTRLPPTKSGVADLPLSGLSGGGIAEAARLSASAIAPWLNARASRRSSLLLLVLLLTV